MTCWPVFASSYVLQPDSDYRATATIPELGQTIIGTIHTPKAPIWVALGDSVSSGHNQAVDAPGCANPLLDPDGLGCGVIPNDGLFSWTDRASTLLNRSRAVPSPWTFQRDGNISQSLTADVLAQSGSSTSGVINGQLPTALTLLARHSDSWNIVSVTGGADDVGFKNELEIWYGIHTYGNPPYDQSPWNVAGPLSYAKVTNPLDPACPNTNAIYNRTIASGSSITTNLQSIVNQAQAVAPGTRVVDMLYPYVVETSNPCAQNYKNRLLGQWNGERATVDVLDDTHLAVKSVGVVHVDPRKGAGFGSTPLAYLQLTRYWGYPHPNDSGQMRLAAVAASSVK